MRSFLILISIVAAVHAANFNQNQQFDPELFAMLKRNEQADRQQTVQELMQNEQFSKLNRNRRAEDLTASVTPKKNQTKEEVTIENTSTQIFDERPQLIGIFQSKMPRKQKTLVNPQVFAKLKEAQATTPEMIQKTTDKMLNKRQTKSQKFDPELFAMLKRNEQTERQTVDELLQNEQFRKLNRKSRASQKNFDPELFAMLKRNEQTERQTVDELLQNEQFRKLNRNKRAGGFDPELFAMLKRNEQTERQTVDELLQNEQFRKLNRNKRAGGFDPELFAMLKRNEQTERQTVDELLQNEQFRKLNRKSRASQKNFDPELFAMLKRNEKDNQQTVDEMASDDRFRKFFDAKQLVNEDPRFKRLFQAQATSMNPELFALLKENANAEQLNIDEMKKDSRFSKFVNKRDAVVSTTEKTAAQMIEKEIEATTPTVVKRDAKEIDPNLLAILKANQLSEQLNLEEMKADSRFAKLLQKM